MGENDSKKLVAEEAEGLESKTNDAIEKAEGLAKEFLEKKHVDATKEVLLHTSLMNLPPQSKCSVAF